VSSLEPGSAYDVPLFVGEQRGLLADEPVLPYPDGPTRHSSGWSGSDTSHERALTEDADGTTSDRQRRVLLHLTARGSEGTTWKELGNALGWHHGQASGALSNLHKEGHVARLATVRRSRCAVYVLPHHVDGRETATQGRDGPATRASAEAVVRRVLWQHQAETGVQGLLSCQCGVVDYFHAEGDYTEHLFREVAKALQEAGRGT
jgi:hypothetical protein